MSGKCGYLHTVNFSSPTEVWRWRVWRDHSGSASNLSIRTSPRFFEFQGRITDFPRTNPLLSPNQISELSRFIASGRLHCTIDKVNGIVETNRPALKNAQYETVIRQGDLLLNSVQRLSKVLHWFCCCYRLSRLYEVLVFLAIQLNRLRPFQWSRRVLFRGKAVPPSVQHMYQSHIERWYICIVLIEATYHPMRFMGRPHPDWRGLSRWLKYATNSEFSISWPMPLYRFPRKSSEPSKPEIGKVLWWTCCWLCRRSGISIPSHCELQPSSRWYSQNYQRFGDEEPSLHRRVIAWRIVERMVQARNSSPDASDDFGEDEGSTEDDSSDRQW